MADGAIFPAEGQNIKSYGLWAKIVKSNEFGVALTVNPDDTVLFGQNALVVQQLNNHNAPRLQKTGKTSNMITVYLKESRDQQTGLGSIIQM